MIDSFQKLSLADLLDACTNQASPQFDDAWLEFIRRYKNYIAAIAIDKFKSWNKRQIKVDFTEEIDDIINSVFFQLFIDDFFTLRNFKNRNDERSFCAYLATITERQALRSLAALFPKGKTLKLDDKKDPSQAEHHTRWQIFDTIVDIIRGNSKRTQKNAERDLLIFNLYTFEGFSRQMIKATPLFKDIGERVVDNAVGRCRDKLEAQMDKNSLRELLK